MELLEICKTLESEGMPFPVAQCGACQKTTWRKDQWFQCPSCGALGTAFGGMFTHADEASDNWIAECGRAQLRIDELREQ